MGFQYTNRYGDLSEAKPWQPHDSWDEHYTNVVGFEDRDAELENYLGRESFGFTVSRSTNAAAVAHNAATNITFDTIRQYAGGWVTSNTEASFDTFSVPQGGAGTYHVAGGIYWAAATPNPVYVSVTVNDIAVAASPTNAQDRAWVSAPIYLNVGDYLHLHFFNLSGGNLTPTAFAGDASTPPSPFLSVWRVAR